MPTLSESDPISSHPGVRPQTGTLASLARAVQNVRLSMGALAVLGLSCLSGCDGSVPIQESGFDQATQASALSVGEDFSSACRSFNRIEVSTGARVIDLGTPSEKFVDVREELSMVRDQMDAILGVECNASILSCSSGVTGDIDGRPAMPTVDVRVKASCVKQQ